MSSFWKSYPAAVLLSVTVLLAVNPLVSAQDVALTPPDCTDQSAACLYKKDVYRLDKLAQGCLEQKKVAKVTTYRICRNKGKVVSVSEALTEAGDGVGYWFKNGKVIAVRYFHDGTLVIFNGTKISAIYADDGSERITKPTSEARKQFQAAAAGGYKSIFKVFGVR
jgi:hypothetical protein